MDLTTICRGTLWISSQTCDVCVNCRSVSGWRGAPRRRLTACRDRPHARASHACEEGSHCFTITSTGRRASSVRSLSTEQRQLLAAEHRRTCARVPRGPAPRQRVRNARLSARREFKACEGARPGLSGGVMGGLRRRHVTTTPRLTFDARRARRARRMICSSIMSLGLSVRPSWTEICELDVDGRCSRPTASASMIAHVELTLILSPVPART